MKLWKYLRYMAAAALLTAGQAAHAGIPVSDAANLVQAIQQVAAWGQQYEQMVQSLQNQVQAIQNMEGTFAANDPLSQAGFNNAAGLLPQSIQALQTAINNPNGQFGQLQSSIQAYVAQNRILDPNATFGSGTPAAQAMQGAQEQNATNLAAAQQAYQQITNGMSNIQNLVNQLDSAPSAKETMDLQGRLAGEQAAIQNTTNQLKALELTQQAQAETQAEMDKERAIQSTFTPMKVNW